MNRMTIVVSVRLRLSGKTDHEKTFGMPARILYSLIHAKWKNIMFRQYLSKKYNRILVFGFYPYTNLAVDNSSILLAVVFISF